MAVDAEIARLTTAIAGGGADVTPLSEAIRTRQARRSELIEAIAATTRTVPAQLADRATIERE